MRKYILLLLMTLSLLGSAQNHWEPNYHQFPTNMSVIAVLQINGMEQRSDSLELGVFHGDDCRGSCILRYFEAPVNRYLFFLTAYGNNGDAFTFKLYDHITEQELDLVSSNEMSYQSNDVIGLVSNPYVFSFTGGDCNVSLVTDPLDSGTVEGGGVFLRGTYCSVTATPQEGGSFVAWKLGDDILSTEPSFSFNAVVDIELRACFVEPLPVFLITAVADPEAGGVVTGAGEYEQGATCVLEANPAEGYVFLHWTEAGAVVSEEPSYSFVVDSNRDLVACFEVPSVPVYYEIRLEMDPAEGGTVSGAGSYEEGTLCTVSVELHEHYRFMNWTENGVVVSEEPSYSFVVDSDRELVAQVEYIEVSSEDVAMPVVFPNPTHGKVQMDGMLNGLTHQEVGVYDVNGNLMLRSKACELDLSGLDDGVYYIRTGNGKTCKVVLIR